MAPICTWVSPEVVAAAGGSAADDDDDARTVRPSDGASWQGYEGGRVNLRYAHHRHCGALLA